MTHTHTRSDLGQQQMAVSNCHLRNSTANPRTTLRLLPAIKTAKECSSSCLSASMRVIRLDSRDAQRSLNTVGCQTPGSALSAVQARLGVRRMRGRLLPPHYLLPTMCAAALYARPGCSCCCWSGPLQCGLAGLLLTAPAAPAQPAWQSCRQQHNSKNKRHVRCMRGSLLWQ